jgi:hypothetical protein
MFSQLAGPRHRRADSTTVLGGVKGTLAALGGSAALDPACAPVMRPPLSMAPCPYQ